MMVFSAVRGDSGSLGEVEKVEFASEIREGVWPREPSEKAGEESASSIGLRLTSMVRPGEWKWVFGKYGDMGS